MSLLQKRALKRIPLTAAIAVAALTIWGASASRLASDESVERSVARVSDSVIAHAPSPRAPSLTATYFRALGIDVREERSQPAREAAAKPAPKPVPLAKPARSECQSTPKRVARQATPPATVSHEDSSHLMTARAPRSDPKPIERPARTDARSS